MNCHITFIGPENMERGFPNTLGKALSPKVGRYFNSMILAEGGKIYTKPRRLIDLKTSNPAGVQATYELGTGLAEYFRAVRGVKKPALAPVPPPTAAARS
jgi:hypothetical protein